MNKQQAINEAIKASLKDLDTKVEQQNYQYSFPQQDRVKMETIPPHPCSIIMGQPTHNEVKKWINEHPNHSPKYMYYWHKGEGYVVNIAAYDSAVLPIIKIKHYANTNRMVNQIGTHTSFYNILVHDIEDIQPWDRKESSIPTTCPYSYKLTWNLDTVYVTSANKLYMKMAKYCKFKLDTLKMVFKAAGSDVADGYNALYELQSYRNPKFCDPNMTMEKPTLGKSTDITKFCKNLHNYGHQSLNQEKPTALSQYEYAIAQINKSFPGEYTKGIAYLKIQVNLWKGIQTQGLGPRIKFPTEVLIEGSKLIFTIMNEYDEKEAKKLFHQDKKESNSEEEDEEKERVIRTLDYNQQRQQQQNKEPYRPQRTTEGRFQKKGGLYGNRRRTSKPQQTRQTAPKFRENVCCIICSFEGHNAQKDGCIQCFNDNLFEKIERKYPKLVKSLLEHHENYINLRAKRRRERTAHVTLMEAVIDSWSNAQYNEGYGDFCVNAATAIFPDIESEEDQSDSTA